MVARVCSLPCPVAKNSSNMGNARPNGFHGNDLRFASFGCLCDLGGERFRFQRKVIRPDRYRIQPRLVGFRQAAKKKPPAKPVGSTRRRSSGEARELNRRETNRFGCWNARTISSSIH